jgi:hypothetical protein
LASRTIDRQDDAETQQRLDQWCKFNDTVPFGFYAFLGAEGGKHYGENNQHNAEALKLINDFDWLASEFSKVEERLRGR